MVVEKKIPQKSSNGGEDISVMVNQAENDTK